MYISNISQSLKWLVSFMILTFCTTFLYATNLSEYFNDNKCDKIIDKEVYNICYSYKDKGALFVAYTLNGNLVNKTNIKKRGKFYSEKKVPIQFRSKSSDYRDSGYDKGHLASDASFDYDKKVLRKTYSMANIIPQSPTVNRRIWIKSEKLERIVASKLGTVSVLNGVVYGLTPPKIGRNQISVPYAFWKMIYNDKKNYKKCFYYKNDLEAVSKGDKLRNHLIDCNKKSMMIRSELKNIKEKSK